MVDLNALLQMQLEERLTGRSAQQFEAAANRQAQLAALSAGVSRPGVSGASAARAAAEAGARASVGAAAEAARFRATEQSQALQLQAQLQAQEQARIDRFVGAGLSAGGGALGTLLQGFGGEQQPTMVGPQDVGAQPGVQALRAGTVGAGAQQQPTAQPAAQTPAATAQPVAGPLSLLQPEAVEEDPLQSLLGVATPIAGALNPLAGLALGGLGSLLGGLG